MIPRKHAAVWFDDRWIGNHGIGRYAHEVVRRIPGLRPLGLRGSPSSPLDAVRYLPNDSAGGLVYSPGFNPLVRAHKEILTIHDLIHLEVKGVKGFIYSAHYKHLVRPTVRRAGAVITVSETSRSLISDWLDDNSVRIVNAGIGVSSAFQATGAADGRDLPYVLYVGNLREHKNVDVVFRAAADVNGVLLRMLLPKSDGPRARGRASELGIANRVELMHGVEDEELAGAYRGAAATVMPSIVEGFGLPALESIMCGTPVLYWEGCSAVHETAQGRGIAVASATDHRPWVDALRMAVESPRRVTPPPADIFSWDRTAAIVAETLSEFAS